MLDGEAFGQRLVTIVRSYVDRVVEPVLLRLVALEARQSERGERGLDGAAGADGCDGKDGRDGSAGADGAPGRDGEPGAAGTNGRDGADGAAGANGRDGAAGKDGAAGADGRDGVDGKDGIGASGALIDRGGNLVLTMADGTVHGLGQVVGRDGSDGAKGGDGQDGRDGRDGKDGRDGFGFDDLAFEHDGERGFVLRFVRGDHVKEFPFRLPAVLDRGVFKEGQVYETGDAVTWAGSLWIARATTTAKPGEIDSWRLAVKKGRDGKSAGGH